MFDGWQLFWNVFGGAMAGILGMYLVSYLSNYLARPIHVKTYLCANNANWGQENEELGELMHNHGGPITEKAKYKELGAKNPIWEWTKEKTGIKVQQPVTAVIYGPYTTDCPTPGTYIAVFRIRAMGLPKLEHLQKHLVLLTLDVNQIKGEGVADPRTSPSAVHRRVGIRYLRAGDLVEDKWQDFKVRFYSDASGVWEYRVIAKDGEGDQPNNIDKFGEGNVKIFVDTIVIKRIPHVL